MRWKMFILHPVSWAFFKTTLSPPVVCANLLRLAKEINILLAQDISMLHLEIMDGHYVPPLCFSVDSVATVAAYTSAMLEEFVFLLSSGNHQGLAPLYTAGCVLAQWV